MKVVIVIDSFKNCASSSELALHIEEGIKKVYEHCMVEICPIADGGEGTVEALGSLKKSKFITVTCANPIGKNIKAQYVILKNNMAIIEMASASGLELISQKDRNPNITTTFGAGEIIKDAIRRGVKDFIIGIGGSATNDAGLGMLRALGFRFFDKNREEVVLAKDLGRIVEIDQTHTLKELKDCKFKVACDVNNPLYGPNGAVYTYARQKGADEKMIFELDTQLRLFAETVEKKYGKKLDEYPGAGAAGGLGFGFLVFLNSELKSGIKIILELLDIENKIKSADFVITGEGKIDKQSSMGKVISGVGEVCKKEGVVCITLTGNSSETKSNIYELGITSVFSILNAPINLKDAMTKEIALDLIEKKSEQIFRLIKSVAKA